MKERTASEVVTRLRRLWAHLGKQSSELLQTFRTLAKMLLTVLNTFAQRAKGRVRTLREGIADYPLTSPLFRLSGQLYGGIGMAASFTLIASVAAWFAFDQVSDAQQRVNEDSIPQLTASFSVAQQASALAAGAPRLGSATSEETLFDIERSIREQRQRFETELLALTSRSGERFDRVRNRGGALITNIEALIRSASQRFSLLEQVAGHSERLDALQSEFDALIAGYPSQYRGAVRSEVSAAMFMLASVPGTGDELSLGPLQQRFDASVDALSGQVRRSGGASGVSRSVMRLIDRLSEIGSGRGGMFELRATQLEMEQRERSLLIENFDLAGDLLASIEGLVGGAEAHAADATLAAEEALDTGRLLLVVINGISILGALLVAWVIVGRLLLPRLQYLSDRMRAMAKGDLEEKVDIGGRDEVSDMAAALEVFRRHALEVQRLNLVEKLAGELRSKNTQLESALEELHHMQNQIVAREKLAGLGELTAGVAHEIRNPLNFVKNFSEACQEMLADMAQDIAAGEVSFDAKQTAFLEEYHTDLGENLSRIRNHGARAERIVGDMLKLGGSGGERSPVEVNDFIDNQVKTVLDGLSERERIANLRVERQYDDKAGKIEVVVQDFGRVLQNLVANACYAISERLQADDAADLSFEPMLTLLSKRHADRVEVRIQDNGVGIAEENMDKIFNPFFTTKPTDQGTGLGLSLCADIMRGHGGSVRAESEHGRGTEVILDVPIRSD